MGSAMGVVFSTRGRQVFKRLVAQSPFLDQVFTVTFAFSRSGVGPFLIGGLSDTCHCFRPPGVVRTTGFSAALCIYGLDFAKIVS